MQSEAEVALDRVGVLARELAEGYADAAGLTDDAALRLLFQELAEERGSVGRTVDAHVRRLHELPRGPDPDWTAVQTAARHVRSAFSSHQGVALLRDREHHEDRLAERLAEALETDLPADTLTFLRETQRTTAQVQIRLAEARAQRTAHQDPGADAPA